MSSLWKIVYMLGAFVFELKSKNSLLLVFFLSLLFALCFFALFFKTKLVMVEFLYFDLFVYGRELQEWIDAITGAPSKPAGRAPNLEDIPRFEVFTFYSFFFKQRNIFSFVY